MKRRPHPSVSIMAPGAIAVALILLLVVLAGWAIQSYTTAITRAEERTSASAKIVAGHASWIYQMGIQATRRIDDALRYTELRFDGSIRDIAVAAQGLPDGVLAYVVDEDGRTLYSTDPLVKAINITDREYFTAVRDGKIEYVSSLLISRLNGKQIFVFSRRVVRNGEFRGVITVSVPADIMRPIWETVDLGGNYAVSFIREDGMMVARYPFPDHALDLSDHILFTKYLKQASVGTYVSEISPMDGFKRLVAYRRVDGTPFIAVAAADYRVLIAPFWKTMQLLGIIALIIIVAAVAAASMIRQLIKVQEKQSAELAEALDRNQMLLREIHHRVKNNLQSVMSLVRLQMRGVHGVEALNDRIKSMIAVHEQIYKHDEYDQIDAAELIRTVVCTALSAHDAKPNIDFDLHSQAVTAEHATALALLINELVTNAIKYAYPSTSGTGTLEISLQGPDQESLSTLIVKDNGAGYDVKNVRPGTGSRLIDGSVRQLNGSYRIEQDHGTRFIAQLKLT